MTGSVSVFKLETEKTEPNPKKKTEKNRAKPEKPS
jgi:hypothetical protein